MKIQATKTIEHWLDRFLTRQFVAVSEAVKDSYVARSDIPADRISVVRTGISVDDFAGPLDPLRVQSLRHELGLAEAFPVLINIGRFGNRGKGQHFLVSLMPYILELWPRAKLLLVGTGVFLADVEEQVRAIGLGHCINLLGQRLDVRDLLAISDLFVFPSVTRGEGLPNALLEAMAAGKPVVAARMPTVDWVVEDGGSGYLVDPQSPEALAQGILRVLELPERLRLMGERGKQIVQNQFDARATASDLERVYLSVLERG